MGEFVPTEAPLEGELAAQLTEGSRLGLWPSLAPEAQIPSFWNIRVCIPPPAAAFLKKSRTPQTRLSPGQLRSALRVRKPRAATASIPSRGAKGLYEFARGFSAPVLRTAPHPPPCSGGTFPGGEASGPTAAAVHLPRWGRSELTVHKLPRNSLQKVHAYSPIHAIMGSIRKNWPLWGFQRRG